MKKIFVFCALVFLMFLTGCEKNNNVISSITKKVESSESYKLKGELEIINNETSYLYDVESYSLKGEMFKVILKNKINNHEQILLKNNDGVYVLNPSLNKSFKFQSEWPYNNSQAYLLETLLSDIKSDKERKIEQNNNEYVITVKTNYTNNPELTNQKIYINNKNEIYKVEVLDKNSQPKIIMKILEMNMNAGLNESDFSLDKNATTSSKTIETSSTIKDITYPMYLPENTNLSSQDTIKTNDGERIILTFSGDNNLTIIEQNVKANKEYEVVNMEGDPIMLGDSIGSISEGMITWISNDIEYYATSSDLENEELVSVARSISNLALTKSVNKTIEK